MGTRPLEDLSKCRILLSNDDGVGAEGLAVLEKLARTLSDDVWVVAPAVEQSGTSHSLTLHEPLRPVQVGERRFSVSGTPTDSMMVAINHLLKDRKPDLVLSGINMGANLGEDVHYSGTVAAALEATLLGVPSIALSQVIQYGSTAPVPWAAAEKFVPDLVRRLCTAGWPASVMMNINIPNRSLDQVKGVVAVSQGKHKLGDDLILREDPRGRPYIWIGPRRSSDAAVEGTDLKAVDEGYIAVTPLNVDLTHGPTLAALRGIL
jgi:5'-nucleotidase